jgi:tetratricopeptide (TPR) repeat protein
VEYHLNNYEEALEAFERVIDVRNESYMAHNNMGVIQLLQSRYEEALKHFNLALQSKPDYADAFYNKGVALCNLG